MLVSLDERDFANNPKVLNRILSEPHGFFRFVNRRFSQELCDRFRDSVRVLPSVNLHGDAHLEQYAVTGESRGLTDFDDATTGPPLIDLVRMGVSIDLAAQSAGWEYAADRFFDRMLQGYIAALRDPTLEAPVPSLVTKFRKGFDDDPEKFFEWLMSVIEPLDQAAIEDLSQALEPYIARMVELEGNGASDRAYFDIVEAGALNLGIGSALDEKYILRVQGPTPSPDDDVALEVKQVRDLRSVTCIQGSDRIDPFRILVAQSRIAYTPYRYMGYIRHHGRAFWIHSWVVNYRELDLSELVEREDLLEEVLYDIGVQLGRGHPNQIAAPLDAELRAELLAFVGDYHDRMHREIHAMSALIRTAWEDFVVQAEAAGLAAPQNRSPRR